MFRISSFRREYFCRFILFAFLISENLLNVFGGGDVATNWLSCKVEFSDKEAKIKIIKDCATKHKFKLNLDDSFEKIQDLMKEVKSKDFDDGCFTQCWYKELDLIDKDGKVKMSTFDDFYKTSNITTDLLKEVRTLFEGCVKTSEEKFKDVKEIPCKMYTMVEFCVFEKVVENTKRLQEICSKSAK